MCSVHLSLIHTSARSSPLISILKTFGCVMVLFNTKKAANFFQKKVPCAVNLQRKPVAIRHGIRGQVPPVLVAFIFRQWWRIHEDTHKCSMPFHQYFSLLTSAKQVEGVIWLAGGTSR